MERAAVGDELAREGGLQTRCPEARPARRRQERNRLNATRSTKPETSANDDTMF